MKKLQQINKFYYIFGLVLILLSVFVIFTANTIFSAMRVSNQIDEELLQNSVPHVNKDNLDQAYTKAFSQNIPSLDLRQ